MVSFTDFYNDPVQHFSVYLTNVEVRLIMLMVVRSDLLRV